MENGMKRYKVFGKHGDPVRLIASVVLAFVVMLFINGFIGSMGGVPAFVAFALVFYRLRTVTKTIKTESKNSDIDTKRSMRYLLLEYALRYLVLWAVFRIGLYFSRITGWGNIRGVSAKEYVKEVLDTAMLDQWVYFFAGVLMFAFVLSLFPLTVIRQRMQWVVYALVDGAGFALLCNGINSLCVRGMESGVRGRATCLMDALLLCRDLQSWQVCLFLGLILLFMIAEGIFIYVYACHVFSQKPKQASPVRWRLKIVAAVLCGILTVGVVTGIILFMPEDTNEGYSKVAEFLTGDERLGPMEYGRTIYVPVDEELTLYETGTAEGYLAARNEDCSSRFYQLAVANLLYTDTTGRTSRVQMKGASENVYVPVAELEASDAWKQDEVFLLWDEDWESESAYSHVPTGYTACNLDLIEGLSMQFEQVTYRPEDFLDYDAYFTIRAYPDMEQALTQDTVFGDWVGCILIKDDKFYFGSYENQITGICLQQLRAVLGGN
jgi:hypothetical protein